MIGHTPGPWVVVEDKWSGLTIESGNARDMAERPVRYMLAENIGGKRHGKDFDDYSEVEANARLIAAAPDMLAALQALDNLQRGGHPHESVITAAWAALDAAIAKATQS